MVLAKLVRGDQRDVDYAHTALDAGLLDADVLLSRIPDLPVEPDVRGRIERTVRALARRPD